MNFKFYPASALLSASVLSASVLLSALGSVSTAYATVPEWQTSTKIKTAINITPSTAGLVFFRPSEQNGQVNTSTNITIDGQYLTSLHDGHFASSQVCAGTHRITATPTGVFSNDLTPTDGLSSLINVPARTVRYVKVNVNNQGITTLEIVDEQIAKNELIGTLQQSHQISRVTVNDCHNYANP